MTNKRGLPAPEPSSTADPASAVVVTSRAPRLLWGLLVGALMVGGAATAVAAPMTSPGVVAPIARLVNIESTKAARGAYVDAQLQNGWEILPSMQMSTGQ